MTSKELREKFLNFFKKHGHKIVPSSSLLPADTSVLFTTAGMQQFKPYYLGEKSPYGKNVASCQKCIRTSDIEEVGDERHLTFFEMLGNFSFGGYFKEEAIKLAYNFVAKELGLEIDYVTVFSPDKVDKNDWRKGVPEDKESFEIWKKMGLPEGKIKKEGVDNFWGPTGDEGPCGPTTEIYVNGIEIWNVVFNEFFCDKDKKLKKLDPAGVDTGMGLERLAMVMQKVPTVFKTDLFEPIIKKVLELSGKGCQGSSSCGCSDEYKKSVRIVADHLRAVAFLVSEGVVPSNLGQGYIVRRLLRRAIIVGNRNLKINDKDWINSVVMIIAENYKAIYPELGEKQSFIIEEIKEEEEKFGKTLESGSREFNRLAEIGAKIGETISGKDAFNLYQTYGYPVEILQELAGERGIEVDIEEFKKELEKHQELSRTASAGMFKGGLADASEQTTKLHTAAHLMLAGLRKVLGPDVFQKGSNITAERLRFDFSHKEKMTPQQIKEVEDFVNQAIKEDAQVAREEVSLDKAKEMGAVGVFESKYGDKVKVYTISGKNGKIISREICGGPHVNNTGVLGNFKIIKEESSSSGVRRIKAILSAQGGPASGGE